LTFHHAQCRVTPPIVPVKSLAYDKEKGVATENTRGTGRGRKTRAPLKCQASASWSASKMGRKSLKASMNAPDASQLQRGLSQVNLKR